MARLLKAVRVNTENGALIAAFPPGRQQQVIPVLHGPHMAVDLQQKVFPAVNTLGLATGPAGTTAFRGIEPKYPKLASIILSVATA